VLGLGMLPCAILSASSDMEPTIPRASARSKKPTLGVGRKPGVASAISSIAGFNADAAGRRVFDGILPHVAGAGRKWLNHRLRTRSYRAASNTRTTFNPADTFPFSYAETTDHLTGRAMRF